jgi:hypothetical protein
MPASSIDVSDAGVTIDGSLLTSLSVSSLTRLLGVPRIAAPDEPWPDDRGVVPSTLAIWDSYGIRAFTAGGDAVSQLDVHLAVDTVREKSRPDAVRKYLARGLFDGRLTIGGLSPTDAIAVDDLHGAYIFVEATTGEWTTTFSLLARGDIRSPQPFRELSIVHNHGDRH